MKKATETIIKDSIYTQNSTPMKIQNIKENNTLKNPYGRLNYSTLKQKNKILNNFYPPNSIVWVSLFVPFLLTVDIWIVSPGLNLKSSTLKSFIVCTQISFISTITLSANKINLLGPPKTTSSIYKPFETCIFARFLSYKFIEVISLTIIPNFGRL